jgi:hypothetical protein
VIGDFELASFLPWDGKVYRKAQIGRGHSRGNASHMLLNIVHT